MHVCLHLECYVTLTSPSTSRRTSPPTAHFAARQYLEACSTKIQTYPGKELLECYQFFSLPAELSPSKSPRTSSFVRSVPCFVNRLMISEPKTSRTLLKNFRWPHQMEMELVQGKTKSYDQLRGLNAL